MKPRWAVFIGLAVVSTCVGIGYGQSRPPSGELSLYAGVSVYNNPAYDSVSLVEFAFSVNRNELDFFRPDTADTALYARVFAQVEVMGPGGLPVDSASTYFSVRVASGREALIADVRVFNRLALFLKPQVYSARLTVIDAVSKRKGEIFFGQITVRPPVQNALDLSDLCLAYDIRPVSPQDPTGNARLARNGLYVIPNPNNLFSEADTTFYVYGEVYGLAYAETAPSKYEVSFALFDDSARTSSLLGRSSAVKPGNSAVIAQSVDIKGWPPGKYRLQVVARDLQSGQVDTAAAQFRVVSREKLLIASRQNDQFDPYDTLSLAVKVNLVQYLLDPVQKKTLAGLTPAGQQSFLAQYWREHDRDPGTPQIENRLDLIERYDFANRYFSIDSARQEGWRTDRGRIYLTFGAWDERQEVSSPRVGNPFEIWYYRQLKEGKHFVFEDRSGTQDYRLVHSNVYGEVYNKTWEELIEQELLDVY